MATATQQNKRAERFFMSFGATLQKELDDSIENFNKGCLGGARVWPLSHTVPTGNVSESTCAGSTDNLVDMRTRSSLLTPQTSKSYEEFWHFYRGADSLADMPSLQTPKWQEEKKPVAQKTFRWDRTTDCDYWKLPLESLSDDEPEEVSPTKSHHVVKATKAQPYAKENVASRSCYKCKRATRAAREASLSSSLNSHNAEMVFAILADQIY
jgi:hypothetical protein